jgi:hypothetical protein
LSEVSAISSANPDPAEAKKAVVYHIHWKKGTMGLVLLDDSSFPQEKEVLIVDGMDFKVLSIETKFIENKDVTFINLLR